jgi:hypothetical protein
MAYMDRPKSGAECIGLLVAVLGCLDTIALEVDDPTGRALSFAAIRVQEAIDLIRPFDTLNS